VEVVEGRREDSLSGEELVDDVVQDYLAHSVPGSAMAVVEEAVGLVA